MWNLSRIKPGAVRMRQTPWAMGGAGMLGLVVLAILASGCSENKPEMNRAASTDPTVRIVKPERRNINYSVEQPGFVQAYEQTSIFSKVSGFIKQFNVDIGQEVKKGDLLAEIFVPELDEEHQRKMAQVELDKSQVDQAQQLVKVAESNVQMAIAQLNEAKANVGKSQAEVIRWESEVKRLTQMVQEKVVDKDILTETQRQLDSSKAARDAAQAAVAAREADRVTSEANLGKAKIDVETQKAKVKVSEADERKAAAMLAYTQITAPYDGVVTVRNANTGDYVQAVTGDKSIAKSIGDLRRGSHRHIADFPGRSRGLCPLRAKGDRGRGSCRGVKRLADTRQGDPDLLGDTRKNQDVVDRDRSLGQRVRRIAAGNVRLYKSARPTTRRFRITAEGAYGVGQPNLLFSPAKQ